MVFGVFVMSRKGRLVIPCHDDCFDVFGAFWGNGLQKVGEGGGLEIRRWKWILLAAHCTGGGVGIW